MEMEEPCWREMVSQKALILIGSFFFFFVLCFSFKLFKNFPRHLTGSAVACFISGESLLSFLIYFKFLSSSFFFVLLYFFVSKTSSIPSFQQ